MTRRALVIAYFFPPLGGVGVQRSLKYVTYLPDSGWEPVVIAPRDPAYWLVDPGSLARLPAGLEVHRSFLYEPARLHRTLSRLAGRGRRTTAERLAATGDGSPRGAARRLARWAWSTAVRTLTFPDEQMTWIPWAVRSAVRAHRRQPAHAIYSSASPVTAHLVAGLAKRRTGLPWIADFRDPWIGNSFLRPLPRPYRRLQRRVERWIVETADRVVFTTPSLQARYADRYPQAAARFATIPNGYDLADLSDAPAAVGRSAGGRFHLIYTGGIYGVHELAIFLDGVELALKRRPDLRERLDVELLGWLDEPNQALAARYLLPERLGRVVRLSGWVPRPQALARLRAADAGLLLLAGGPDRDLFVGSKLYDYLGLDRQVLAVVPPGDARRILADLQWGIVADPTPQGVADGLERLLATPAPDRPADPERRYDRRVLTARLAALLDEVAG